VKLVTLTPLVRHFSGSNSFFSIFFGFFDSAAKVKPVNQSFRLDGCFLHFSFATAGEADSAFQFPPNFNNVLNHSQSSLEFYQKNFTYQLHFLI